MAVKKGNTGEPSMKQKILNNAAALHNKGFKKVCRKRVEKMCGVTNKNKRSHDNALGLLRKNEKYLTFDKETIELNEEGMKNADPEALPGNNDSALAAAKKKCPGTTAHAILDIVMDGKDHTADQIYKDLGLEMGDRSYSNVLGKIKREGFIEYCKVDGKKGIRATDDLIPFRDRL